MTKETDPIGYDEEEAVKFIQNYLPQDLKDKFSGDEINYIIDIVYDFYESKGFMDPDTSDEDIVDLDEDELISYVIKCTKKEKISEFTEEEITFIIQGELKYCESIDIFE